MAIWFVSTFWLLWLMVLWTFMCSYLFECLFSILWGIYLGVELLGHFVILCPYILHSFSSLSPREVGFFPGQPKESWLTQALKDEPAWPKWRAGRKSVHPGKRRQAAAETWKESREEVHSRVGVPHEKVFSGHVAGPHCLEDPQRRGILEQLLWQPSLWEEMPSFLFFFLPPPLPANACAGCTNGE